MGFIDTLFRGMDPLPRFDNLFRSSKQKSTKSTPILMLENSLFLSKVTIMKTKENVQSHSPWTENLVICNQNTTSCMVGF